jgi:malate dehydrogenase (oxaloacetate-decarboxylating)
MSASDEDNTDRSAKEKALRLHRWYRGKIQSMPKCPVRGREDLGIWYTPGVAAPSRAVAESPERVFEYTNRGNTVAIVTDGSRVLGLGNIGPEAALPVMEGKALLFKLFGGVDAVPVCLATQDPEKIVAAVELLEPGFGGVNLEDIEQPKCFSVLDTLRERLRVPVWHDDQQGTATVVLAALRNALEVVGKERRNLKIAMIGMGAANVATYRLLKAEGVDPRGIIACDSKGTLHTKRGDIESRRREFADKWRVCTESNAEGVAGGVEEALRGADAAIAFSSPQPGIIKGEWLRSMNAKPIVFACANPEPEIWPADALEAGAAVVCTGRSDFPNQLNNSLCFPGLFRGVLDVRASAITDGMAMAAADAIGGFAAQQGLRPDRILPPMEDWTLHAHVAAAVGVAAEKQGVAPLRRDHTLLYDEALLAIRTAHDALELLVSEEVIPASPEE